MDVLKGNNFIDRGKSLLEDEHRTDCTFIIGNETKEVIKACSIPLILASPVFDAMFYGSVPQKQPVEITDIEPNIFRQVIKFAYCHSIDISSRKEAAELCRVADKYLMNDLLEVCSKFLMPNDITDIWLNLECVASFNLPSLVRPTLRCVQANVNEMLSSQEFNSLTPYSLAYLLKMDFPCPPDEIDLFNATVRWTKCKCEEKCVPPSGTYLREILLNYKILGCIRFLRMPPDVFAQGPAKSGILDSKEVASVLIALAVDDPKEIHPSLSPLKSRTCLQYQVESPNCSNNGFEEEEDDGLRQELELSDDGSSDMDVITNNNEIDSIDSGSDSNWFEFEETRYLSDDSL